MDLNADERIRNTEKEGGHVILLTVYPPDDHGHSDALVYISSPKEKLSIMGMFSSKLPEVLRDIIFFAEL